MKAAELYRLLAAELRPHLLQRGFRKLRGSRLAFQRVVRGTYQTGWFRADTWGWDAHAGSRFFVSFTVSESPTFDTGGRHDEGLFFFLTDAELAGAHDFRDSVVARIPRPPPAYFETFEKHLERRTSGSASEMLAAIRAQFEPDPIPYRRHHDVGMRYWLPTDVTWWATLIASVLPRAIEQMDAWSAEAATSPHEKP